MITVRAPAKLNLRLVVLARETSGFHQIETLFCTLALADDVEVDVDAVDGIEVDVEGASLGPARENLAYRAARVFFDAIDRPPRVRIRLHKCIPAGAGLGGGSSDAAATLMALQRAYAEPLDRNELLALGGGLGSDVPYFLANAPLAIGWGRGQRLLALPALPVAPVLLALPDARVSTPDAYVALDDRRTDESPGAPEPQLLLPGWLRSWDAVADIAHNDFEPVVFERIPDLRRVRDALAGAGATVARLTGSGSALFGVFPDAAARDAAADAMRARFPGFHVIPTMTLGSDADAG